MATFVIAEIGVNHNGSLDVACKLIDAAKLAGADAVKFQTFSSTDLVTDKSECALYQQAGLNETKSQLSMLQELELSRDDFFQISSYCEKQQIQFLSTPFEPIHLDFLVELGIKAIKVPSGEITNIPFLEHISYVSSLNDLPIYLSTGMSSLSDIQVALEVFYSHKIKSNNIFIMHCTSAYPAPIYDLNLSAIKTIKNAFNCKIGYSDHSDGINASIIAVAYGAEVLEKHITLDKNMMGPDHKASIEPHVFRYMVENIREVELMIGDGIKKIQPSELNVYKVARRSIRASKFISKGTEITLDMINFKRPNDGLSPVNYKDIIGRPASSDYNTGDCINEII